MADVVITTAAIPGKKAPVIITNDMVGAHEVRRHHRRHGRRIRRQLRPDPARRARHRQRREHPRPAQPAVAHADPRLRAVRQEHLQLPLAVDQGRRTEFDWSDEIVAGTLLCKDGATVNTTVKQVLGEA
jgi:H+-translocating NAD(P) transhydrogenase subunit alpha